MSLPFVRQVFWRSSYIQVVQGDITEERVDAIVNASNGRLMHGGGVAAAISKKGGPQIQEESNAWVNEHGEVKTGRAAVTGGGRLFARYVIHAVGPVFNSTTGAEKPYLAKAIESALEKADELKLVSLAIPAISSGIYGCPKDLCAETFFEAVPKWLDENPLTSLKYIRLTNIDSQTVKAFEHAFDEFLKRNEKK